MMALLMREFNLIEGMFRSAFLAVIIASIDMVHGIHPCLIILAHANLRYRE
ncbi:MAG: hypothetical protein AB8B56_00040 [Crocinitomicaceae bacterium]